MQNLHILEYWFRFALGFWILFWIIDFCATPFIVCSTQYQDRSMSEFQETTHPADKQNKIMKIFKIINFTILLTNLLLSNPYKSIYNEM